MLYRTRFENEIATLREFETLNAGTDPTTYYFETGLNIAGTLNKTGLHVPVAAETEPKIDLIVYFHGFVGEVCKESASEFMKDGIQYYWKHDWFKKMRSELDKSGRAAILVAPTLHRLVGAKGSGPERHGNLDAANAFDKFVNSAMDTLEAAKAIRSGAEIGNIVLAAHSGGGLAMHDVLKAKNTLATQIRACWGFECLYYPWSTWLNWLNADKKRVFRHFRQQGVMSGAAGGLLKAKHKNYVDTTTSVAHAHCGLLRDFWITAIHHMPETAGAKESF